MRFWAINEREVNEKDASIELKSGRRVWIKEGDKIVIFESFHGEIAFHSHTSVVSAALKETDDRRFSFSARLSEIVNFDESRVLSDFSYSLEKIYRYSEPARHFRRPYVELSEDDFRTLSEARIYWARTAFGLFINQLPQAQLVRFMQQLAASQPDVLLVRSTYGLAWRALREFIEEEYISAVKLFETLRSRTKELERFPALGLTYEDLRISSDDNRTSDSISEQDRLFSRYADSLLPVESNLSLLEEIDAKVKEESSHEVDFEKLFRGTPWPIEMTES